MLLLFVLRIVMSTHLLCATYAYVSRCLGPGECLPVFLKTKHSASSGAQIRCTVVLRSRSTQDILRPEDPCHQPCPALIERSCWIWGGAAAEQCTTEALLPACHVSLLEALLQYESWLCCGPAACCCSCHSLNWPAHHSCYRSPTQHGQRTCGGGSSQVAPPS